MNIKTAWQKNFNESQSEEKEFDKVLEIERFFNRRIEILSRNIPDIEESTILDMGGANGYFSRFLHPTNNYLNIDFSEELLKEHQPAKYSLITYNSILGDVENTPIKSKTIDVIFCFSVTQCLKEPERLVREIHRILKPGGDLYLVALNSMSPINRTIKILNRIVLSGLGSITLQDPNSFREDLEAVGFCQTYLETYNVYLPGRFKKYGMFFYIKATKIGGCN